MRILYIILGCLTFCQAAYDYGDVIRKSLLFYEAQRSGKLPSDQSVTWRKDSALNDKGNSGEDLTGGYYDAGDFVKFGFPMAYTITTLAWGAIDYANGYNKANAMDGVRKAIKWGTDYFMKAHVHQTTFYGQIGDGQADHNYWGRPEDMTMARPAYRIDTSHPGSDLAAETAAALAAASIVFKSTDPTYSQHLLTHAKQLFTFADTYRGKYSDSISDAKNFYSSSGYEDELVWGAVWLYKATGDNSYLTKAEQLYTEFGLQYWNGNFGWDQKISGAEVLLSQITKNSKYTNKVKGYCDWMMNSQQKTPKGLVFIGQWGSLRSASNVAFICLEAASAGISSSSYRNFAKQQINYMLGDGGRSYVVGYGNNPPTHAHHRSSSCPDAPAACDWNTFNGGQANAHVLYGALVGGPGANDDYQDVRNDAVHNEVACDYNAGFQSALAALNAL
uniref:cellulase n=1 Tax=Loboptera decipiens TaxID=242713 RepID=A0A5A4M1S8_LOBDE|nr:beta-1,4-endoglucanase [Loboptera decipiens]